MMVKGGKKKKKNKDTKEKKGTPDTWGGTGASSRKERRREKRKHWGVDRCPSNTSRGNGGPLASKGGAGTIAVRGGGRRPNHLDVGVLSSNNINNKTMGRGEGATTSWGGIETKKGTNRKEKRKEKMLRLI